MSSLLQSVIDWIINLVSTLGYGGVFLGMMIEAASIPLPSEIIMGIAGFLVYKGELNLFLVALVGAIGNAIGSTSMYVLGSRGGRPALDRYGKYVHIDEKKFLRVENWFNKYGDKIIFIGQLLPIVRTFISLPLGILKVNFVKFRLYTFTGAFLWCLFLAYISSLLGPQWEQLSIYMKQFEVILALIFILAVGYTVWRVYNKRRRVASN